MLTSHKTLKLVRQIHLYFGLFISPALLFFAFTGAMQTFSLHETTRGSSYKPPAWIVTLAQLHKKQTATVAVKKAGAAGTSGEKTVGDRTGDDKAVGGKIKAGKSGDVGSTPAMPAPVMPAPTTSAPAPRPKSHLPMKIFFLMVALGLFTSTLTGVYMSYKYARKKVVVTLVLLAGVVVPLLLLPF